MITTTSFPGSRAFPSRGLGGDCGRDSVVLPDRPELLEGFSVYGDAVGVEWPEHEGGPLSTFELLPLEEGSRGRKCRERTFEPPDWTELLPPEVSAFARDSELRLRPGSEPVLAKAWHSGSHPYLAHEFVSSIVEGRKPAVDAVTAARWTAPGIHAHESAMADGKQTAVTRFG